MIAAVGDYRGEQVIGKAEKPWCGVVRIHMANVSYSKLPASCIEHPGVGAVQVRKVSVQPGRNISRCRSNTMPTAR